MHLDSYSGTTAGPQTPDHAERTFGFYIRRLRRAAGLEPKDMGLRLGISPGHYSRVEIGSKAPLAPGAWGPLLELGADEQMLHELAEAYRHERAGRRNGHPSRAERAAFPAGHPRSSTWESLPWEEDDWCWYVVAHQPDGLSQAEVSLITGWCPELVRRIEESALATLRENPEARELFESLVDLCQHRDEMRHAALCQQAGRAGRTGPASKKSA